MKHPETLSSSSIKSQKDLFADGLSVGFLLPTALLDHLIINNKVELVEQYRSSKRMTIMATLWREALEISREELTESGAYEAFSIIRVLLNYYDDFIDNSNRQEGVTISQLKTAKWGENDEGFEKIVSDLVEVVCSADAPRKDKQVLCSRLNQFRREQYKVYREHELGVDLDAVRFEDVARYRELTSGSVMQIMAATMNVFFPNISQERKEKIEETFFYFGVAGQYLDDLADWWKDDGLRLNLFSGALNEFPDERDKVRNYRNANKGKVLSVNKLRKLAPQSISLVDTGFTRNLECIPEGGNSKKFKAIIRISYHLLPQLYACSESEPLKLEDMRS